MACPKSHNLGAKNWGLKTCSFIPLKKRIRIQNSKITVNSINFDTRKRYQAKTKKMLTSANSSLAYGRNMKFGPKFQLWSDSTSKRLNHQTTTKINIG